MEKMTSPDILGYLKSILEGRSDRYFHAWFSQHAAQLQQVLSRSDYLNLKFDPLSFAENRPDKEGISYNPNTDAIAYQRFPLTFSPEFLDEKSDLRRELFLALFDGMPADYYAHAEEAALAKIDGYLDGNRDKGGDASSQDAMGMLYFFQTIAHADPKFSKFGNDAFERYFAKFGV
jgi:hypothetical protein